MMADERNYSVMSIPELFLYTCSDQSSSEALVGHAVLTCVDAFEKGGSYFNHPKERSNPNLGWYDTCGFSIAIMKTGSAFCDGFQPKCEGVVRLALAKLFPEFDGLFGNTYLHEDGGLMSFGMSASGALIHPFTRGMMGISDPKIVKQYRVDLRLTALWLCGITDINDHFFSGMTRQLGRPIDGPGGHYKANYEQFSKKSNFEQFPMATPDVLTPELFAWAYFTSYGELLRQEETGLSQHYMHRRCWFIARFPDLAEPVVPVLLGPEVPTSAILKHLREAIDRSASTVNIVADCQAAVGERLWATLFSDPQAFLEEASTGLN